MGAIIDSARAGTVRARTVAALTWVGRSPLVPLVLVAVVAGLDAVMRSGIHSILATGLLDEPAHLSTATLVLFAVAGGRWLTARPLLTVTALAMSMLIDVDHLPLYAGVPHVADGGRPYSHSLTTVLVLALLWLVTGRRRAVLAGAAVGVCLHFVRDLATGPGIELWWPLDGSEVLLPYRWYLGLVIVLGVIATGRALAWRRGSRRSAAVGQGVAAG